MHAYLVTRQFYAFSRAQDQTVIEYGSVVVLVSSTVSAYDDIMNMIVLRLLSRGSLCEAKFYSDSTISVSAIVNDGWLRELR